MMFAYVPQNLYWRNKTKIFFGTIKQDRRLKKTGGLEENFERKKHEGQQKEDRVLVSWWRRPTRQKYQTAKR